MWDIKKNERELVEPNENKPLDSAERGNQRRGRGLKGWSVVEGYQYQY